MANASPAEPVDSKDVSLVSHSLLHLPDAETLRNFYAKLTPAQRTWRCEQMKKSSDLVMKAWELLQPISVGRWNKENAYMGLSLFIKAMYEGQGCSVLPQEMSSKLSDLMQVVQENLPYVEVNGCRIQTDDSPARYAIRIAFNCMALITIVSSYGSPVADESEHVEMQSKAVQMASNAIDKLGGPLTHEGTLTAAEKGYIVRLATASGPDVQSLVSSTPVNILALYMLQAQYDIELRVIKWILHYVAARCAKEELRRTCAPPGSPACTAPRAAWVRHSSALGKLDPGSPLGQFMAAEARVSEGPSPDTLALMRAAAATAERRGDDILSWLARLHVAQLIVNGAQGPTFSEDEVLREMDAAAAQEASVKRWCGDMLPGGQCPSLKEYIDKTLQTAREQRERQLAESGSDGKAKDDGRLPSMIVSAPVETTQEVSIPQRQCDGCKCMFHTAMACGKCKQVWYCGRQCQLAHWRAGHKKECAALANATAKAAGAAETAHDVDE